MFFLKQIEYIMARMKLNAKLTFLTYLVQRKWWIESGLIQQTLMEYVVLALSFENAKVWLDEEKEEGCSKERAVK